MLVLSRRVGESIIINNNIRVQVSAIRGNQIRLAIDAPREVEVHRDEVYDRIYNKDREVGGVDYE